MRRHVVFLICLFAVYHVVECGVRRRRQTVPQIPQIANGELITSIFQIPIQTLGAVRDLLQTTRGRFQAIGQAYQVLQAAHPNHRPNPHFTYDRFTNNNRYGSSNYGNNYASAAAQSNSNYIPQNYNRRRIHNSKALVQPRNNALSDESSLE